MGGVRIWRQEKETRDPTCLLSTVQAGGDGVMVWGMLTGHTLGLVIPIQHHLNAAPYLSIVADQMHIFMATIYPSSDGFLQHYNAPLVKSHLKLVSWT